MPLACIMVGWIHRPESELRLPTLSEHFVSLGQAICAERTRRYAEIRTPDGVRDLQRELRHSAREIFGSYAVGRAHESDAPPRVMRSGTLEVSGVVIEKLVFEAFRDYWVSANLYRPAKSSGKCPAVVMPVGHWWDGKATAMYQRMMRLLARRGIVCVSFDGEGQGERIENFNPAIREVVRAQVRTHPKGVPLPFTLGESAQHGFVLANNVTSAHCLINDPGYLCGVHLHGLRAATGKRLIDLLISRSDVDPGKIGACGASGGGTDSRLLAALDERIALLAPTSILGQHDSVSGGDADQCFFHSLKRGFSAPDLVICVAPRPLLIVSASADKHDTAKVAAYYRPFWDVFAKGDCVAAGIGEGPHGFPLGSRRLIAEFILKHFRGDTDPIRDEEHSDDETLFEERELFTTLSGNVYFEGLGKSATELARDRALELQRTRPRLDETALRKRVLDVLGESELSLDAPGANVQPQADDFRWESTGGVPLQIVRSRKSAALPRVLYAHDEGSIGADGSPVYLALKHSLSTATLDVRGTGISATPGDVPQTAFLAPLLMGSQSSLARLVLHQGRTLTGLRVADLLQAAKTLGAFLKGPPVSLVAEGGMGLCALAAAYLRPDTFQRIVLVRTPVSWTALATGSGRRWSFADYLYGVLEHFDTPDLTRQLSAEKLLWLNASDGAGQVLPPAHAREIHPDSAIQFAHAPTPEEAAEVIGRFISTR
jgi:hypothetical protein